ALEEAAQTLRASPMRTFGTITLPLMMPGIANAFLIVFIESLADFGNPLLLGGNLEVLSTAIYFAVVGVQQDPGRASVLAVILLGFSLALFLVQRRLLAKRSFVTIGGKGDGGSRTPLPRAVIAAAAGVAEFRRSRYGRRHRVHSCLQYATGGIGVYGAHPRGLLRLSGHDHEHAGGAGRHEPDRSEPRRSIGDAARRHIHFGTPSDSAAHP